MRHPLIADAFFSALLRQALFLCYFSPRNLKRSKIRSRCGCKFVAVYRTFGVITQIE
nr:MAG TPA: hypothetical protein [Caudoviricetes sp.]